MNFCPKCGLKLDGKDKCPKCGFLQKAEENSPKDNNVEDINPKDNMKDHEFKVEDKENYDERKKKNLKFIVLAVVALILIVSGVSLNKYYSNPELAVKQFKDSVIQNNLSKLEETLYCEDTRLQINDDNTKILLDYFKKNPSYLNEVINSLEIQSKRVKENKLYSKSDKELREIFYIQKSGKKLLIFPSYKIAITPGYINVTSKIKGIKIQLNGKECCKSDSDNFKKEIGPLMPGNYKLTAEFSNKFTKKSSNKNIDLIKENLKVSEEDIIPDLKYINIESDVKNAKIFANGKDTGITASQATQVGPVDSNCVVYGVDNSNGKTLRTEDVKVGDGKDVYLSFSNAIKQETDFKGQIYSLLNGYASDFAYAVNYNNFSYIQCYLEPNSQIYNAQKKVIGSIHASNIREDFLGLEILNYSFDKNTNEGTVTTKEVYDITKGSENTSTKEYKNTYKFIRRPDGQLMLTVIVE